VTLKTRREIIRLFWEGMPVVFIALRLWIDSDKVQKVIRDNALGKFYT